MSRFKLGISVAALAGLLACGPKPTECMGGMVASGDACKNEGEICAPDPCVGVYECVDGAWEMGLPAMECVGATSSSSDSIGGTTSGGTSTGGTAEPTTTMTSGVASSTGEVDPCEGFSEFGPCENDAPDSPVCPLECANPVHPECPTCPQYQCFMGTWGGLAQPLRCGLCSDWCGLAVMCPDPPTEADCFAGCLGLADACERVFIEAFNCDGAPMCDEMNRPAPVGCEAEYAALYECFMP